MTELEQKLNHSIEQNKMMSKSLGMIKANGGKNNSNLGINTHNLTEDGIRNKIGDYSDL
jgi:hypothetical protein